MYACDAKRSATIRPMRSDTTRCDVTCSSTIDAALQRRATLRNAAVPKAHARAALGPRVSDVASQTPQLRASAESEWLRDLGRSVGRDVDGCAAYTAGRTRRRAEHVEDETDRRTDGWT